MDHIVHGSFPSFLCRIILVVHKGKFHVLYSRGFGQKIVVLEDEADFAVAQYGAFAAAHLAYWGSVQNVFSAGGGIQTAELVQ